eukprot:NODE_10530_length_284_cov_8.948936_g8762_i0.p2 GENE.NODE_10530_length_284_cov_8.948936_g8762_i0~~NODE_10530_length_284_cov_8.948936_g8762_i0.p2  ORF type:complete len:59 (+),score=13.38 NODE_10530_length_284_cov_8.948936_g8762_i0:28-204(+)
MGRAMTAGSSSQTTRMPLFDHLSTKKAWEQLPLHYKMAVYYDAERRVESGQPLRRKFN